MIHTLFFSRLAADLDEETTARYLADARRLEHLARQNEGFVDLRRFVSEDGERLTLVRFRDAASQAVWRRTAEHVEVQKEGRATYYESYRIVILEQLRERAWTRDGGFAAPPGTEAVT